MAIKLVDEYVNAVAADADYPGGSFKNATSGAGVDGTPLEKAWANDWLGFFQALLAGTGTVPSGAPDTALASQYFDAMMELIGDEVGAHALLTNPHSAVSAATASRLMLRDAAGRAQVANPAVAADIANRGWVMPGSLVASDGYRKHPDGTIEQWGTFTTGTTKIFPIPFPTACLNLQATFASNGTLKSMHHNSVTTSDFLISANYLSGANVFPLAIAGCHFRAIGH